MRPVDSRMRYEFEGALYTPPPKIIYIYFAANAAKLCEAFRSKPEGAAERGSLDFLLILCERVYFAPYSVR